MACLYIFLILEKLRVMTKIAEAFEASINSNSTCLNVSGLILEDDLFVLADFFNQNVKNITIINFSSINIKCPSDISEKDYLVHCDPALKCVCERLKKNATIKKIIFSNCSFDSNLINKEFIKNILINASIEDIEFDNTNESVYIENKNGLGWWKDGIIELESLINNKTIKCFTYKRSESINNSIASILDLINNNITITHISLKNFSMEDNGDLYLNYLINALRINSTITNIEIEFIDGSKIVHSDNYCMYVDANKQQRCLQDFWQNFSRNEQLKLEFLLFLEQRNKVLAINFNQKYIKIRSDSLNFNADIIEMIFDQIKKHNDEFNSKTFKSIESIDFSGCKLKQAELREYLISFLEKKSILINVIVGKENDIDGLQEKINQIIKYNQQVNHKVSLTNKFSQKPTNFFSRTSKNSRNLNNKKKCEQCVFQ